MFSSVNTCWTLVGAFLVYFMQAGFALCEAGFTRAKNTGNILMKNMMDFCIGTPCYWLIGFGLMFGGTGALIGGFDPFIQGDYSHLGLDIPLWVYHSFKTTSICALQIYNEVSPYELHSPISQIKRSINAFENLFLNPELTVITIFFPIKESFFSN